MLGEIGYYIVNYEQNGKDRAEYGEKVIKGEQVTLAHHTKEYENNPAPCNTMGVAPLEDGSTIVVSHLDLDTLRRDCCFNGKKKRR